MTYYTPVINLTNNGILNSYLRNFWMKLVHHGQWRIQGGQSGYGPHPICLWTLVPIIRS